MTRVTCLRRQLDFFFIEAKTLPFASKILNMKQLHACSSFLRAKKRCFAWVPLHAFAMFSAPWCSEPGRRSKTSTPKEWVARRGSQVAMLRLASWARMEKNSTPQRKVLLLVGFVDRECCWCFFFLVRVGWWDSFFPSEVLAMIWW